MMHIDALATYARIREALPAAPAPPPQPPPHTQTPPQTHDPFYALPADVVTLTLQHLSAGHDLAALSLTSRAAHAAVRKVTPILATDRQAALTRYLADLPTHLNLGIISQLGGAARWLPPLDSRVMVKAWPVQTDLHNQRETYEFLSHAPRFLSAATVATLVRSYLDVHSMVCPARFRALAALGQTPGVISRAELQEAIGQIRQFETTDAHRTACAGLGPLVARFEPTDQHAFIKLVMNPPDFPQAAEPPLPALVHVWPVLTKAQRYAVLDAVYLLCGPDSTITPAVRLAALRSYPSFGLGLAKLPPRELAPILRAIDRFSPDHKLEVYHELGPSIVSSLPPWKLRLLARNLEADIRPIPLQRRLAALGGGMLAPYYSTKFLTQTLSEIAQIPSIDQRGRAFIQLMPVLTRKTIVSEDSAVRIRDDILDGKTLPQKDPSYYEDGALPASVSLAVHRSSKKYYQARAHGQRLQALSAAIRYLPEFDEAFQFAAISSRIAFTAAPFGQLRDVDRYAPRARAELIAHATRLLESNEECPFIGNLCPIADEFSADARATFRARLRRDSVLRYTLLQTFAKGLDLPQTPGTS